jgi:hypothetical protein
VAGLIILIRAVHLRRTVVSLAQIVMTAVCSMNYISTLVIFVII